MTTNIASEVISLLVGLLTTVVVPWLNKRFGTKLNPDKVGAVATDVLDGVATRFEAPASTNPATSSTVPVTSSTDTGVS